MLSIKINIYQNITFFIFFIIVTATTPFYHTYPADATPDSENIPEKGNNNYTYDLNGYIASKYLFRSSKAPDEHSTDHDLFEEVRLDLLVQRKKNYAFHFYGTAREDLNGDQNRSDFFPFEDIGDTQKSILRANIYEAHFDVYQALPHLNIFRIGRQSSTRGEPIFFDGISADIEIFPEFTVTGYGGAAVHFFEMDGSLGSDFLGGIGIDYDPFSRTFLSLDYLYVRDEQELFTSAAQTDHLLTFKARQRIFTYLKTMVKLRLIDGKIRDVNAGIINTFPRADLEISLSYFGQFFTQNMFSNELSNYYYLMGKSYPYHSVDLRARKLFGTHFAVDAGFFSKGISGGREESAFNHNFTRIFTAFEVSDIITDDLWFAVNGEYWMGPEKQYISAGFDTGYRFKMRETKDVKISGGTYFSLYKYDYYEERGERNNTQTYHVKARIPIGQRFTIDCRYEYERGIENYHLFNTGLSYDF